MKKTVLAGASALAVVALTTTAAFAAPVVDGGSVTVAESEWTGLSHDGFSIDDMATGSSDDIWDGIGYFQFWDITNDAWIDLTCLNADVVAADDATGDQVLTCDPTVISPELEANVSARFYAEGDMVRFTYTLTNISDTAVDYDWWAWGYYGDAVETMDTDVVNAQGWEVEEGEDNGEHVGVAWGLGGADGYPLYFDEQGSDSFTVAGTNDELNNLVIDAGASVSYAIFAFHNAPTSDANAYPSTDFASLEAWAADTFDAFDGRLTAGLPTDVPVLNWGYGAAEEVEEEALAETGVEAGGLLAGGAALVLGAAAVVALRRRTV